VTMPEASPGVSDQRVRALRQAREIVAELRWDGLAVPEVYGRMAGEFQALVRDGRYHAWLQGDHRRLAGGRPAGVDFSA
jgi:hypothetical protein